MSWRELKWQCSGLEGEAQGPNERRAEARLVRHYRQTGTVKAGVRLRRNGRSVNTVNSESKERVLRQAPRKGAVSGLQSFWDSRQTCAANLANQTLLILKSCYRAVPDDRFEVLNNILPA